jgi:hypothetical protein
VYIDKNGLLFTYGNIQANGGTVLTNNVRSISGAVSLYTYDASSDLLVAAKIGSFNTITHSGAKILALYKDNFSTLVGYFNPEGSYSQGGLTTKKESVSLANNGTITLPSGPGWGYVMIGNNQERAQFSVASDGTVTLDWNTDNVINTDTDGYLCIFQSGTNAVIKNRLGSTLTVKYIFNY